MVTTRSELIALIHESFSGVSRKNGVSWSESDVIDDYGTADQRAQARASDFDQDWRDVVDSSKFRASGSRGSFCFLDAIGCLYYLPAAMCQSLIPSLGEDGCAFDYWAVSMVLGRMTTEESLHRDAYHRLDSGQLKAIANYIACFEAAILLDSEADLEELPIEDRSNLIRQAAKECSTGEYACFFLDQL